MSLQKRGFILTLVIMSIILSFISLKAYYYGGPSLTESEQWESNLTDAAFGAAALGDVDNDGDLDLILTGLGLSDSFNSEIYLNNGTSLTTSEQWGWNLTGVIYSSIAWGDIDNDGYLDLVITGCSHGSSECDTYKSSVYTNNGTSLEENISWQWNLTGVFEGAVALGDVDIDGDLDLVSIGCSNYDSIVDMCTGDEALIYINNGTSFEESEQWQWGLTGVYRGSVAFGDIDNDGDLELALTGRDMYNTKYAKIYTNNGTNLVENSVWEENLEALSYSSLAFGDYDNDGDLDLVLIGFRDSFNVYENDGSTFLLNQTDTFEGGILSPIYYGSLAFGDYSNNGYLSLAAMGKEGATVIYENREGVFDVDISADNGVRNLEAGAITWGDLDRDDDLDLILIGSTADGSYFSEVYINNRSDSYANTPPTASTSFENYSTANGIFFGWDEGNDTETNVTGLYYNLRIGNTSGGNEIVSGVYSGGEDNGYFGNMMQRRNITLKIDRFSPDATYYWSVQTIDTALNASNWSEEQRYTTTSDITYPAITLDRPVDFFNQSSNSVVFNFTVVEDNIDTCELEGNWTGSWQVNESIISPPTNNTNGTSQVNFEEGVYIWNVMCNDTLDNRNYGSTNFTLTVDSTPPLVSIEGPDDNATNNTANSIDFTFNVTDFLGIVNCSLVINDGANLTANNILKDNAGQNITVWLNSGDYNWTVNCTDSANNYNGTFVYNLSLIDGILPEISLDNPADNYETSDNEIGMNFTVTEVYLDTCELWSNWSDGWHLNQTYRGFTAGITQNFSNISLPEGQYVWSVYCNDTSNNYNNTVGGHTFTVDNTFPTVSLKNPVNGETWTKGAVNFTYQVSDFSSVFQCQLYINNSLNNTQSSVGKDTNQTLDATLFDDEYEWYVNCTDGAGNVNNSETRYLTQSCTVAWNCGGWSGCIDGTWSRNCTNASDCPGQANETTQDGGCEGGVASTGGEWKRGGGVTSAFDLDFSLQRTKKNLRIAEGATNTISFDGIIGHTIKIDKVMTDSVTLTISSEPVTITVGLGKTVTIDLNKDGIMDLKIILDSIMGKMVDIIISKLLGADLVVEQDRLTSKQKFSLSREEIRTEVTQGETVTESFSIKNNGQETLELSLEIEGLEDYTILSHLPVQPSIPFLLQEVEGLEDYTILSDKSLVLNKGESKNVDIHFIALAEQEPKSYIGKVIIKTAMVKKELPLVMTVRKREALFDVIVEIPEEYKEILAGDKILAKIDLFNIGKVGKVDIILNYFIKDSVGNTIITEQETVGVETKTGFTKTFPIPKTATQGNYTYSVRLDYKDTSTTGQTTFLVKSKMSYIPAIIQKRLVEILVWVFGTALLFTLYFLIRSKFKEKYLEKEEKELKEKEARDYDLIKKLQKRVEEKLPNFDEFFYKQSLTKFCKEKLEQGYTEKQILKAAKQAGWQEEMIRKILEDMK